MAHQTSAVPPGTTPHAAPPLFTSVLPPSPYSSYLHLHLQTMHALSHQQTILTMRRLMSIFPSWLRQKKGSQGHQMRRRWYVTFVFVYYPARLTQSPGPQILKACKTTTSGITRKYYKDKCYSGYHSLSISTSLPA